MTVHVSVRSISAVLLLSISLRVILDAETGDVRETLPDTFTLQPSTAPGQAQ